MNMGHRPLGPHMRRAVGFASSPALMRSETWSRWFAEIEAYADTEGLRLASIITDRPSAGLAPAGDGQGFDGLVQFLRERVHERDGQVDVVIVPTVEHLSPARDGSEGSVQLLLRLHFGVAVRAVLTAQGGLTRPPRWGSLRPPHGAGVGAFASVLFGLDGTRLPGGPR